MICCGSCLCSSYRLLSRWSWRQHLIVWNLPSWLNWRTELWMYLPLSPSLLYQTFPPTSSAIENLSAEVSSLKATVTKLTRNHSRQSGLARSRSNSPDDTAHTSHHWCFYHRRFGSKAKKCQPPCTFHSGNAPARA